MRIWGVHDRHGLSEWLGRQGFPRTARGNHISARAQEFSIGEAVLVDARSALLEAVCVVVTLHVGRDIAGAGGEAPEPPTDMRQRAPPVHAGMSSEGWEQLDRVNLNEIFLERVPVMKTCPRFLRGRLRFGFGVALQERLRAKIHEDVVGEASAWKLFGLVPLLLQHKPKHAGAVGRDELAKRADDFAQGRWLNLLSAAREQESAVPQSRGVTGDEQSRRGAAAQQRVERGQISRARHELTGAPWAPRNMDTLQKLREKRPQERESPVPQDVSEFVPDSELRLDPKIFAQCLQTAPAGCSP